MWPVPSNVRYATWKKKTPGTLLLRKILRKFLAFDDAVGEHGFGPCFHGYEKRDLSVLEDRRRAMIRSGSMLKAEAKSRNGFIRNRLRRRSVQGRSASELFSTKSARTKCGDKVSNKRCHR